MSQAHAYLGIWLIFSWIIVPALFVWRISVTDKRKRRKPPKWLIPSAKALLDLDAKGGLVPHGIGNGARDIITEFLALHSEDQ